MKSLESYIIEKMVYTKNTVNNKVKNNWWRGVEDVKFIYVPNGDSKLKYEKYVCYEHDIETSMLTYMRELNADGENWGDPHNDEDFNEFCQQHTDSIYQDIEDMAI